MLDFLIVIPARYKSSRFPGKPLALIKGKPMLQRVWEKCIKTVEEKKVIVATDSNKIINFCNKKNYNCIMTSSNCLTGTDRVAEVAKKIKAKNYVNVQGDEPLVLPKDIKSIINAAKKYKNIVINGMCEINNERDFRSLNVPKVIIGKNSKLLYMSRSAIPIDKKNIFKFGLKQVCIYSFPRKLLLYYATIKKKTFFEKIEDIEILRFLELGIDVKMIKVSSSSIGVDVPRDIIKVNKMIKD